MTTAKLSPEDQHLLNLVKLAPLSEDRQQKLELLIPTMTDAQKYKLLNIVSTQLVMQVDHEASKAVNKTLEEVATNPNKAYDPKLFTDAINKVWNDFVARKTTVNDSSQINDVRASLQALQDKLKKISSYADEAQKELTKHL